MNSIRFLPIEIFKNKTTRIVFVYILVWCFSRNQDGATLYTLCARQRVLLLNYEQTTPSCLASTVQMLNGYFSIVLL